MLPQDLHNNSPTLSRYFENALIKKKLSHTYLFCGEDVEIKRYFAKELIKLLNCKNLNLQDFSLNSKACNSCTNCLWINEDKHPEVLLDLRPDETLSKRGVILLKQVKALQSQIQRKTNSYRAVIISNAESYTLPSEPANALLKTLEEPNPNLIFFLFAADKDLVLPTISSRCLSFHLPKSSNIQSGTKLIAQYCQELEIDFNSLDKQKNFSEAGQLAQTIAKGITKTEGVLTFLDRLQKHILENIGKQLPNKALQQIDLIENTKKRIKAFVPVKNALEDMFWKLS